jgi:dienelactone hydrolase
VFGARTVDRDATTSWQTRLAQYDAVCAWGQPNHSLLERVSAIDKPVFVANGDSDPMILPGYSYLLAGLIPGARLKTYPDAAHGFHSNTTPSSRRRRRLPGRRLMPLWHTYCPGNVAAGRWARRVGSPTCTPTPCPDSSSASSSGGSKDPS